MKNIQNKFLTLTIILSVFASGSAMAGKISGKGLVGSKSCTQKIKTGSDVQVASSFSSFLTSGSVSIKK